MAKHLLIVPGGGSPNVEAAGRPYFALRDEGIRRSWKVTITDYRGAGHYPDFGTGLTLGGAASALTRAVDGLPGELVVFAHSFGCSVATKVLIDHAGLSSRVASLVFWAPVPFHVYWRLWGPTGTRNAHKDREERERGMRLTAEFLPTLEPIEEMLPRCAVRQLLIAGGTSDQLSSTAFRDYLGVLASEASRTALYNVPGAGHDVLADDPGFAEYAALVFEGVPEAAKQRDRSRSNSTGT